MSRILKVLIVLLAITAMVAPTVFAEDRLSLNGQLRVRGFVKDNGAPNDFNDGNSDPSEYFDQRLRVGGNIAVAEGVDVKFRFDLWDGQWGNYNGGALGDADDQAYMVIKKDMFTLSAGDQAHSLGNAIAVDTIGTGAIVTTGPLEFSYFKGSEGATTDDDDMDLYTAAISHGTDLYDGSVFAAFMRSGVYAAGDDAPEIMLLGAAADFKLDAALVKAEINWFDGDDGVTGGSTDLKGIQVHLDGSMAVSETITAGLIFNYAKGYNDAGEAQIDELTDDGSFLPETYGFMQILYSVYPGGASSTFDPTGASRGVIAAQGYGNLKLSDDLSLRGSVRWATPDEDPAAGYAGSDYWEDFVTYTGSFRYKVAASTSLDGVLSYTTVDAGNTATADDAQMIAGFRLAVNF